VENQGCPGVWQQVIITRQQLVLLGKIYFEFDRAVIQKQSFPLLDQVAAVLQEHPELEQVSIDGHTDSVGSAAYNNKLSRDRADAVRQYLMSKRVSGARLVTRGFGFSKPAFPNATPEGRDANRRVEFNIVSIAPSEPTERLQLSHR
jgi:outer membrane protein OmpA-like peptidoglycan-associated protein